MLSGLFSGWCILDSIILVSAVAIGFWLGQLSARNKYSAQISDLLIDNKVLDQKVTDQKTYFESQLKTLDDAKTSLGKEFENLLPTVFLTISRLNFLNKVRSSWKLLKPLAQRYW